MKFSASSVCSFNLTVLRWFHLVSSPSLMFIYTKSLLLSYKLNSLSTLCIQTFSCVGTSPILISIVIFLFIFLLFLFCDVTLHSVSYYLQYSSQNTFLNQSPIVLQHLYHNITYFSNLVSFSKLIRNLFIVNVHLLPDNMQEEFLELVNNSVAKDAFETLSLTKFWSKMSEIYPVVSEKVLNSLLMFPSTYLCEQGFSTLLNMKTKHRSRLNIEHDLQVCLSNTAPRIEELVCNKQAQPSH